MPPADAKVVQAFGRLAHVASEVLGPPSEWAWVLRRTLLGTVESREEQYYDLVVVLMDCFTTSEIQNLMKLALSGNSAGRLRKALSSVMSSQHLAKRSDSEIIASLDPISLVQLLAVLGNAALVNLIDTATRDRVIDIPVSEVRRTRRVAMTDSSMNLRSEISNLGIRAQPKEPVWMPSLSLVGLIYDAYERLGFTADLDWKLRSESGSSTRAKLLDYLRQKGAASVISEFVLNRAVVTNLMAEHLRVSITGERDDALTQVFLWKLGFNIPRDNGTFQTLRRLLGYFEQTVQAATPVRTEDARERIRSAGVNLFVWIENLLEELIVFTLWLLASDHFVQTRFIYDAGVAREIVPTVLGHSIQAGHDEFSWGTRNALGALTAYLHALKVWVDQLSARSKEELLRPKREYPHFADWLHRVFPFRHRELWADAAPQELETFIRQFAEIESLLVQSNLAKVRNGLDHKRPEAEFPKVEEMLKLVDRVSRALDAADQGRFLPKWWWVQNSITDRYGLVEYELRDYKEEIFIVRGPTPVVGLPRPAFSVPFVVAPGNLLGQPNAEIVFRAREQSSYSRYWDDYPRRLRLLHDSEVSLSSASPIQPAETSSAE
jgi:hypothetical protein